MVIPAAAMLLASIRPPASNARIVQPHAGDMTLVECPGLHLGSYEEPSEISEKRGDWLLAFLAGSSTRFKMDLDDKDFTGEFPPYKFYWAADPPKSRLRTLSLTIKIRSGHGVIEFYRQFQILKPPYRRTDVIARFAPVNGRNNFDVSRFKLDSTMIRFRPISKTWDVELTNPALAVTGRLYQRPRFVAVGETGETGFWMVYDLLRRKTVAESDASMDLSRLWRNQIFAGIDTVRGHSYLWGRFAGTGKLIFHRRVGYRAHEQVYPAMKWISDNKVCVSFQKDMGIDLWSKVFRVP